MGMRIDKTKAEKVQKPFQQEEKGWLDTAVESVKEFFTPSEGPSYEEKVSQGLKGFGKAKLEGMPQPTATPTPEPTATPEVGAVDQEHMQKVMAKRYFLQGLGLNWEPSEEDMRPPVEEEVALEKPEEDDDFIDLDEWEV